MILAPAMPAYRVVTDLADLERLKPAWSALLEASASNEPTLSPQWLLTWWQVFGRQQGRRLCCVCFEESGRLIGLAPFLHRLSWYRRCVPFRRLEPLAAGERDADAICSDYLNVIVERGAETRVVTGLARALASGELGSWDELVIPLMDGAGPLPALFTGAARNAGLLARTVVSAHAPYIPLPPTWDGYLNALTKKHRKLLRCSLRDFSAWAGPSERLEQISSRADLEAGLATLAALHRQRWRTNRQGGVFRSAQFNAFHHAVLPRLWEVNAVQLLSLHAHGRPVAAMYNIVWNDKIYFYQSGRDPTLPRNLRPGLVVIAKAIQQSIAAGHREFDFLGGTSRYKMQFALGSRPLVEIRVARPGLRETARHLIEAGAARYRRWRASHH